MSTKTTFKRVALVAVAALGLGVLSVAPSSAVINSDSLTLSAATAAQTSAETATATSATVSLSFLPSATTDSISVTAALVSGPTGNTALPYLELVDTASATVDGTAAPVAGTSVGPNTPTLVRAGAAATITSAKYKVFLGKGDAKTPPTVAGTYVVKLTPAAQGGGALLGATAQTLTITVTTAASLSTTVNAANSTVLLTAADTITPGTSGSDDVVIASKSGTGIAGIIQITQKNASNTSASESITAIITGSGILAVGAATGASQTSYRTTAARVVAAKAGDIIEIFADGASGVGTVTLASASGVALGSKSVTFFDTTPAKATATVKKAYVLASTASVTKVFLVSVVDSAGNAVTNATVTAAPTAGTAETVGGAATATAYDSTAKGYYVGVAGLSSTKFGKVNYTIKATGSDAAATVVTTTADVTFSSGVAKTLTISGASTGGPGASVVYTMTGTDANGYPIADQMYNGTAKGTAGGMIFGAAPTTSGFTTTPWGTYTDSFTTTSGVATFTGVLPIAGDATVVYTLAGDGTGTTDAIATALEATTITVKTTVSNPGVDAATDAANEATDAANAATDAALAAADAADAATAAAQDASDAVAALSASVEKLVASLKAQLTSLTNLVIKIQKKVKA